ncbi:MAG: hypothetical protein ABIP63_07205 [Thermoanaerobaculia bacterium]
MRTAHRIAAVTMMATGTPNSHHGRAGFVEEEEGGREPLIAGVADGAIGAAGTTGVERGSAAATTGNDGGDATRSGIEDADGAEATRVTGIGAIIIGSVSASNWSIGTFVPHFGQNADPGGIDTPHCAQRWESSIPIPLSKNRALQRGRRALWTFLNDQPLDGSNVRHRSPRTGELR